jgi:hypothetical protein
MARISKNQVRQLITDGRMSRSPSLSKKKSSMSSNPSIPEMDDVQSIRSKGRPKKRNTMKDYVKAYVENRRNNRKNKKNRSSDPTQNPVENTPDVKRDEVSNNPPHIEKQDPNQLPELPKEPKGRRDVNWNYPTQEEIQKYYDYQQKQNDIARQKYSEEADKFIDEYYPGLTDKQRTAYEESGDIALNRELASAKRLIDSEMGARGIQGGTAKIPKTELARYALEAKQQMMRDLTDMDREASMQNKIAKLAFQEGRLGQDILTRQQIQDYLMGRNTAKENKYYLDQAYKDYYGRYPGQKRNKPEKDIEKLMNKYRRRGFKVTKKRKKGNKAGSRI